MVRRTAWMVSASAKAKTDSIWVQPRYGTTIDCQVPGKDTGGAMRVLEVNDTGWPRHVNPDQDEWIYVVDGEVELEIGKERFHLGIRESTFIPRI